MPLDFSNLTKEQITILVPFVALAGVFFGSFITAFFPFLTALLARRSQQRWQVRQLAVTAALDHCRHENQLKIELIKAGTKGDFVIEAPDDYIYHMLLMLDIATDTKLSAEEAAAMIARKSRKPRPATPDATNVA